MFNGTLNSSANKNRLNANHVIIKVANISVNFYASLHRQTHDIPRHVHGSFKKEAGSERITEQSRRLWWRIVIWIEGSATASTAKCCYQFLRRIWFSYKTIARVAPMMIKRKLCAPLSVTSYFALNDMGWTTLCKHSADHNTAEWNMHFWHMPWFPNYNDERYESSETIAK